MRIEDISEDSAYKALTEQLLRSACDAVEIDVASVQFGTVNREHGFSWLCFIVDPDADDRMAPLTARSAVDHFNISDPNGLLREVGSRIAVTVDEIELSHEASIFIKGEDGRPTPFSPFPLGLGVVKATFSYTTD